jgi:hypothetical protein
MRLDSAEYAYPVDFMCARLGVSRSGYYAWRTRPESTTAARRGRLKILVRAVFETSGGTYGHRRVRAQLARQGVAAGPELVRQIMRDLGLAPRQPGPKRAGLTRGTPGEVPDLVGRDFTAPAPGTKLVGSGSRRESHPPAPTEPCVIVSHYTALATLITRNYGTIASERTSWDIVV